MSLSEALGISRSGPTAGSGEIVVLYTGRDLTPSAVDSAIRLTRGLDFQMILLAVHIVPYPLQLRAIEAVEEHLSSELQALADASPVPVAARIIFARDVNEAFRQSVLPESLVLIGARKRWWKTTADKWARELAAHGFRTALVYV